MECSKCGCAKIEVTLDSRGLAEARCAECGAFIKKLKVHEVIDIYKKQAALLEGAITTEENRPPCRYCTENYVIMQGSMRTARQYVPITANYCPICGRKLKDSDRKY